MANSAGAFLGSVGRNIALRRRQLGLTQAQLSEQLNIEPASLSRIERGVSAPSLNTLVLMAKQLDCPLASLLTSQEMADLSDVHLISELLASLSPNQRSFVVQQLQTWVAFLRHAEERVTIPPP